MIAKRYMALSFTSLILIFLGFMALAAPAAFRGPLVVASPSLTSSATLGFPAFHQSLYLADAVGIVLLALATFEVWIIAITWEYRRQRNP